MHRCLVLALICMLCACATTNRESPEPRTVVITGASSGLGKGVALKLAARGDNVVCGLTESAVASVIHRAQMEKAPPAPSTAGTLYTPMPEGVGVDGSVRARMAAEDRLREESEPARR